MTEKFFEQQPTKGLTESTTVNTYISIRQGDYIFFKLWLAIFRARAALVLTRGNPKPDLLIF